VKVYPTQAELEWATQLLIRVLIRKTRGRSLPKIRFSVRSKTAPVRSDAAERGLELTL
jgi:hypothetical protein